MTVKTLSSKVILQTPWLTLHNKQIHANGHVLDFHIAERRDSVVVAPITPDGQVVMVKEWKYGAEEYVWQLPAGKADADESLLQAVEREAKEETGYSVKDVTFLGNWYVDSSWQPDVVYLYTALTNGRSEHNREKTELMSVELIDWAEAVRMAEASEIKQPHSAIAILLLRDKLREVFNGRERNYYDG